MIEHKKGVKEIRKLLSLLPVLLVTVNIVFSAISCSTVPAKQADSKGVYHKIKRGQTLWRIAKTYGVDLELLAKVNNLEDATEIETGGLIFILNAEKILEVEIYKPADSHVKKVSIPTSVNRGEIEIIWPVSGRITSHYGSRNGKKHDGVDISVPKGTPIKAVSGGIVTFSGRNFNDYGKMIVIKHNSEFSTVYAHNLENIVEEGDDVKKGQVIGRVGNSGNASGYHLHFEVRREDKPINPLFFLP
ncbi:MAG: LysM peptidoglycan-binding domain-containing M23 family metallopeptidase [Nitrospirota bacterium]